MLRATLAASACAFVLVACAGRSGTAPELVRRAEPPASGALPPGAEARSLAGRALYAPPLAGDELARREVRLRQAVADWERAPHDADATIWLGRRLAYLGRFREALEVYSLGAVEHPDDPRLPRHSGHRWISVREFERALRDLTRAAELARGRPDEVEPDGLPNARGIPLETLNSNIYYHLGLAHYLLGDFESALVAYRQCLELATNDDNRCSATHWLYMTLRRLGREREAAAVVAPIRADLAIVEYHAYHDLCLLYRGERDGDALLAAARASGSASVDFATLGYGVGNWHLYNGRVERAREVFREVADSPQWHAFGCIAAEAELARAP